MRRYLFVIICIALFVMIVLLDAIYDWPPATEEDILISISFITIIFTLNYALSIRFIRYNLFKDYRNLVSAPFVPREFFLKELLRYLKSPNNILLFLASYLFLIYFFRETEFYRFFYYTSSFLLYFVYLTYNLIVIRFICGHNSRGTNTFFMVCLLINCLVMYQIMLADNHLSNLFNNIIVKYNPLNTLYFLPVTDGRNLLFLLIPYLVYSVFIYPFLKNITWEKHLAYI
jgi:hypothetical protein